METLTRTGRRRAASQFLFLLLATVFAAAPSATRAEEPALTLGVFPRFNPLETVTRYTPLAEYLGQRLGRKVELVTAKDFDAFWQGVGERRYDIVQYNQYHYIRSARRYQVIAHNKEFGKSTMAGALYVRKDSGITRLDQLRGRTILFGGGEDAMIAYIAPVYLLLQAGVKKEEFTARFAVNPINSVVALFHKQTDAAGSGDIVVEQPAVKKAINTDELVMLAASEQLLQLPWVVKRTMPAPLRDSVRAAMLDLENSDAGKQILKSALMTGIGPAKDSDYDPHRKMARAVMGPDALSQQ